MTSPACGAEPAAPETASDSALAAPLELRPTADGSPSLWSAHFGQGFHCRSGALQEARRKFVAPAQLDRFGAGDHLIVVETCVGLGYNTAALIEAAADQQLNLEWWGLELDPRPLALALANPGFRQLWRPATLHHLEQLRDQGQWRIGASTGIGAGRWWLGDAREHLEAVAKQAAGRCDLVFHDPFSPGRCPELWTVEVLGALARLLAPEGRLLTYSSAAAVRRALELAGLELATLVAAGAASQRWSAGTVASPGPLPAQPGLLQPLGPMEREHLATRAAEPYRDPSGLSSAAAILAARLQRQAGSQAGSTSAWRRRWGIPDRAEHAR